jgi:integrase
MSCFDPHQLQTAFLQAGTPMFADVMTKVADHANLSHERRRDIQSGLRRVAKALGRAPQDVPADAAWLQKRLGGFAPASAGLTPKSWSNALSDARAGLVLFGVVERRFNRKDDLSPEWRPLWEAVLASGDLSVQPISRFVHFLNRLGVAPADVGDPHLEAYHDAMVLNEISKSPEVATRAAANCWNLAVRRIPEWPSQTFKLPNRKITIKLDVATFPQSFQRDLDRYVLSLEHPDPLDAEAISAPLRPDTIRLYRASVLRFASVLVHAKMPIAEITSLAVLVTPEDAERGLRWLLARKDNAKTRGISEMAGLLRGVAKRYVRVDEACQKRLDKLDALLAVKPQNGMTAKNRDRLRPLDDTDTLRRLLLLPERLFKHAKADGDLYRGALAREDAVAVAILLNCPIRRKNLAEIHLEKNLQRPGDGRVFLVFEADEVKNDQRIEFELPKHVVGMIDRHLASRTPQLCPRGTPWLFPRRDGAQPIQLDQFAMRLKKRILKETGLQVNAHLFRHIAAKIWLDAHPGHYEALRRLLGHKELSQTINAYAGFEAGTATRLFADAVEQATR